jgi:hypothetical protein
MELDQLVGQQFVEDAWRRSAPELMRLLGDSTPASAATRGRGPVGRQPGCMDEPGGGDRAR